MKLSKRVIIFLLILCSTLTVSIPANAVTTSKSYGMYISMRQSNGNFLKIAVGGSSTEFNITLDVPTNLSSSEELDYVLHWVNDNYILNSSDYKNFVCKGYVIYPRCSWNADRSGIIELYLGSYVISTVSYTLIGYVPSGAIIPISTQHMDGDRVDVISPYSVVGYTFSGWSSSYDGFYGTWLAMPKNDIVIFGSYVPNNTTKYRIEFYKEE